jgi:glycerophosphoryl diester phosphodiesterase
MRVRPAPLWLVRPVAHRGLHDAAGGVIENTAAAFEAAIAAGYAIETDLQGAAGAEPVVFHDATLERLTQESGPVAALTPAALRGIPLRDSAERILSLGELLDLVAGRVPVFLEIKTDGRDGRALERKIAAQLAVYRGPAAVMSFDPGSVRAMRRLAPDRPRGLVSMRFTAKDWPQLPAWRRFLLTHLADFPLLRADFLAYHIDDLPRWEVRLIRRAGVPVLGWTVRSEAQRRRAERHVDAIIFEGLRP